MVGRGYKKDQLPLLFRGIGLEEEEWKKDAACIGVDSSIFFGHLREEESGTWKKEEKARAYAFCESCWVQEECFSYAMRNKETFGIWGGWDFSSIRSRAKISQHLLRMAENKQESKDV